MRRTVQAMLMVAIVIDVAYWAIWYTNRDWLASEQKQAYFDFENAFPIADLWLGIACLLALVTLHRRQESAVFWLLCAGSAALYLGAMDLLYDLEHGIFAKGAGGAIEAVIVLLTLVFSVTILTWSWRHRGELLSGSEGAA